MCEEKLDSSQTSAGNVRGGESSTCPHTLAGTRRSASCVKRLSVFVLQVFMILRVGTTPTSSIATVSSA